MEKGKWKYIETKINGQRHFEIIPDVERIKPPSLFKYYALDSKHIDAFEYEYIYAPDRWQLNDAFDCHEHLIDYKNISEETIAELKKIYNLKELGQCLKAFHYEFYMFHGLASLTESPKNTLMWAHYSKNSGFVTELNYHKFNPESFFGPFPINYMEDFDPMSINDAHGFEAHLYQTNVKQNAWEYEAEWRFITFKKNQMHLPGIGEGQTKKANRHFSIKDCFLSITLGHNFFDMSKELVPFPHINELHIIIFGNKLRLVNLAINKNIDIYWIINPDYLHDASFNLSRKKLDLIRIDKNRFKVINHIELKLS